MVKIADLNRRIQFYSTNGFYTDEGGNLKPKWEPYKKRWANKKDVVNSTREQDQSEANTATSRVRLEIRFTTDFKTNMLFSIDDKVYDIISVGDPEGERNTTVIFGEVKEDGGRI